MSNAHLSLINLYVHVLLFTQILNCQFGKQILYEYGFEAHYVRNIFAPLGTNSFNSEF